MVFPAANTSTLHMVALFLFIITRASPSDAWFHPTWSSLDKHVAPSWYDEAKIGVFIHWGVYSVPSFGSEDTYAEWFWWWWKGIGAEERVCAYFVGQPRKEYVNFMKKNYAPDFQYEDFAPHFNAQLFDPEAWADVIQASGAKYFVMTSKHHDGFTNWKSNVSWNWNAVDNGPHMDLIDAVRSAILKRKDIHFCLYHSLFEWFNPTYLEDKKNHFKTKNYVEKILLPELHDMVMRYKPDYIWADGDWEASSDYWNSKEFIAWLYNESPVKDTILVNDRWGKNCSCHHGDVKTCGIDDFDPAHRLRFKWEDAMTLDRHSWGYRRNTKLSDFYEIGDLIALLARTVSCGGNLVMNFGPTADGRIAPIFEERLRQVGRWLSTNGEAIYKTTPWRVQNDTEKHSVWYTTKDGVVNAILLSWPRDGLVHLKHPVATSNTRAKMLGVGTSLPVKFTKGFPGVTVSLSSINYSETPCQWAWVLQLFNVT